MVLPYSNKKFSYSMCAVLSDIQVQEARERADLLPRGQW
jgi:hypothetical protein